ncbi:MAG TPA: oligosaccharide flippase family protein [Anaerolineae bacterium]|nr:oligosaccharide flippase family protein [Anaerolineae bacterium]
MLSKFKKLTKESVIYGLGGAGSKFINLLLLPLYSRIFSVAEYGVIDVITIITVLASTLLTSGTGAALSYFFFEYPKKEARKRTVSVLGIYTFTINILIVLIINLFAEPISNLIFAETRFADYIRIAALAIPFTGIYNLNLNLARLQRKPISYITISIPFLVTTLLLNIYLVLGKKAGVSSVFWSNAIATMIFSFVGIFINFEFYEFKFDFSRFREMFIYWIPMAFVGICTWLMTSSDRIMLTKLSNLEEVGKYAAGIRIASIMGFFAQAFRLANLPFIFETSKDKDAPKVYSLTLSYYLLLSSILVVLLSLFARPALKVLATSNYESAYVIVPALAFAIVADGTSQITSIGALLTKRTGLVGIVTAISALIMIIMLYLFIPIWGGVGAALSALISYLSFNLFFIAVSHNDYSIPFEFNRILRILMTSSLIIIFSLLISPSEYYQQIILAVVLFMIYLVSIPAFSLITGEEKRILRQQIRTIIDKYFRIRKI